MTTIWVIVSLMSTLRAFVECYNNRERQWAMTTMMTKQQQQREEDVEDKCGCREGGTTLTRRASKTMHADTAFRCFIVIYST
jgi:hypothetical protein